MPTLTTNVFSPVIFDAGLVWAESSGGALAEAAAPTPAALRKCLRFIVITPIRRCH
jgi:hypothetical protein